MAYNLSDFYQDTLSLSNNGSSILDSLEASNKFSSLSKISYETGEASKIIGWTETGSPIYDETIGAAYNEELKQCIKVMHSRNNDTILRGIGYNTIENTSTGNIAVFKSQGSVLATITEKGEFTGKISLANIEDLDQLQLDTSKFYNKGEIQNLLSTRVSIYDLYNDDSKIKSELLDADIIRVSDLNNHTTNQVVHITADERTSWNKKYEKPALGIPESDLCGTVKDILDNSVSKQMYSNHTLNTDIHITRDERSKWNRKYDLPVGGVPLSDLSELVQSVINHSVLDVTFNNHLMNDKRHLSDDERTSWNKKYEKPATGIPKADLELYVQDILNKAVLVSDFNAHTLNSDIHITSDERTKWTAKYDKPLTGIPESDLSQKVKDLLDKAATKVALDLHISDSTAHITTDERIKWNDHASSTAKHVADSERTAWNKKYDKPVSGIPESDFSVEVREKIASMVANVDFNQHLTDTTSHLTSSERTKWNAKYDKPVGGIPESDLSEGLALSIANKASQVSLNDHIQDNMVHISDSERAKWNAKYVKPVDGIGEADLDPEFVSKVTSSATDTDLKDHMNDDVAHVTQEEKDGWNAKYSKPETGIDYSDLSDGIKVKIEAKAENNDLTAHTSNEDIHVTSDQKVAWDAKYVKPVDGIGETDLSSSVTDKLLDSKDSVEKLLKLINMTPYKFDVDTSVVEDTTEEGETTPVAPTVNEENPKTYKVLASDHKVDHDDYSKYKVALFTENEDETIITNVTNSTKFKYSVNVTTHDFSFTFKEPFKGVIVIK